MTEVEYEHECSRAELLGLPKPSKEEFFSKKQFINEVDAEDEDITTLQAEEKDARQEGLGRISGGLDELNSILSSTQKKLNRFKNVCGSFTNLLRIGLKKEEENEKQVTESSNNGDEKEQKTVSPQSPQIGKKSGDAELDKLDSLIGKAERAELSLSSQNKQMKKFLN